MKTLAAPAILTLLLTCLAISSATAAEPIPLFNGKNLKGWNGNPDWFRVEDGAIVAGSLEKPIPHNYFLATDRKYQDFELNLKVKTRTPEPGQKVNGGIQIRSVRLPDDTEMFGYQADVGSGVWGALYDESRRRKFLTGKPSEETLAKLIVPDAWNDYRIVCRGNRIQLFLNGTKTADYTEEDDAIAAAEGHIAVQVHSSKHPIEIRYKDIVLTPLK